MTVQYSGWDILIFIVGFLLLLIPILSLQVLGVVLLVIAFFLPVIETSIATRRTSALRREKVFLKEWREWFAGLSLGAKLGLAVAVPTGFLVVIYIIFTGRSSMVDTPAAVRQLTPFRPPTPPAVPSTPAPSVVASPPGAVAVGPGLYVTNVRVSPEKPGRNQDVTFFATFSNTTNTVQNFTWRVYIYKSDTLDRSNLETTFTGTSFPVGSGEYKSLGSFRYGPSGSQCDDFIARVGWADRNNKVTFFTDTGGKVVEKPFSVCN